MGKIGGLILGATVVVAAFALFWVLGTKSGDVAPTTIFFGRFHPLVVHMPICVLILAALLEVLGFVPRFRARLDGAVGVVLLFAAVSSLLSFSLGLMLAQGGGFPTHLVSLHKYFAFGAVVGTGVSFGLWSMQQEDGGRERMFYRLALLITLGLISVGGHLGGTIRRGDGYLTRYAPEWIQSIAGTKPVPAPTGSAATAGSGAPREARVYESAVLPIFRARCIDCHGEKNQSGGLRLDSFVEMNNGGEHGVVIAPGSGEKSPLVRRLELPATSDERMPPDGKAGPSAEEIQVIRFWIDRGAREDQTVADALAPESAKVVLAKAAGAAAAMAPKPASTAAPTGTGSAPPPATATASGAPAPASSASSTGH